MRVIFLFALICCLSFVTSTPLYSNDHLTSVLTERHNAYEAAAQLNDAQEAARKLAATVLPATTQQQAPSAALLESSAVSSVNSNVASQFRPYSDPTQVANLHAVTQIKSGNKKKETPLEMAYNAVQSEVMSRVHEINNEKKWIKSVTALIQTYSKKHSKVQSHMSLVKRDIRNLLRKKKQIQNAIVQRELKGRVKVTSKDLNAVNTQLRRILKKAQEFKRHQVKLKKLLFRMNRQLNHLRGKATLKVKKGKKHARK